MFNLSKKKESVKDKIALFNSNRTVNSGDSGDTNGVTDTNGNGSHYGNVTRSMETERHSVFRRLKRHGRDEKDHLSQDDVKHLEETKHRIFGFGSKGKKRSSSPPSSESGDSASAHQMNNADPVAGPSPIQMPPMPHRKLLVSVKSEDNRENSDAASIPPSEISTVMSPLDDLSMWALAGPDLKKLSIPGLQLPALKPTEITERVVTVYRQPSGDFGFSLRRSQLVDGKDGATRRTVIFAEPLQMQFSRNMGSGLFPGDLLLEVNGVDVSQMTRDEVIGQIRQSGDEVKLKVRPVPELCELSQRIQADEFTFNESTAEREGLSVEEMQLAASQPTLSRTGSKRMRHNYVAQLATSLKPLPEADGDQAPPQPAEEKIWLVHQGGFALATVVPKAVGNRADADNTLPEGKIRVKIASTGDVVEVDSSDVEKVNPPTLDRTEDLKDLLFLNESSVLHVLRQRYGSNLVHTYAGSVNTVVANTGHPLAIYSEKVVQMFKGCRRDDMPPHIYAVGQSVLRSMLSNRQNQAVLLLGRSGAGKTGQMRHLLQYLCLTAGSVNRLITMEKLNAAASILEAFGNCRTFLNPNASRVVTVANLEFDHVGQISAGSFQCLCTEYSRVVRRPLGEANFHIFYFLWEGAEQKLRNELQLTAIDSPAPCFEVLSKVNDREAARSSWLRLLASLNALGVTLEEQGAVFAVLAAIIHLCVAGASKGVPCYKATFVKPVHSQKAANMLGVTHDDLVRAVFHSHANQDQKSGQTPEKNTSRSKLEKMSLTDKAGDGVDALEAFVIGLYRELFGAVVFLINRSLESNYRTLTTITVIDYPGFANPALSDAAGRKAAGWEEFCTNYIHERILGMYHEAVFSGPMSEYEKENIEVDFDEPTTSPYGIINVIDKPSQQNLISATNIELRSQEKRGILWLLDEESIFPGATDESFLERLFVHFRDQKDVGLKRSRHYNHFVLRHLLGTSPVLYNASGWLRYVQENPVTRQALVLLQDSRKEPLAALFLPLRAGMIPGLSTGMEGSTSTSTLRRATTNIYRSLGASLKRKSTCATLKAQMDWLIEIAKRCGKMHFVHCLLAQNEAATKALANGQQRQDIVNVPLLRSQLRANLVLDAVRINKIGFPERMPFADFRRRYECLLPASFTSSMASLDDRQAIEKIMEMLDLDTNQMRLGLSQVFMRSDLEAQLENRRDDMLTGIVVKFQAECRVYLAKKKLEKRKIQELAIRTVQKNVKKYMEVKSWPWWRLYTHVVPLLNVHRQEEELRTKEEELEALREKCARLEKLVNESRGSSGRTEAVIAELKSELQEERARSSQTSDLLEQEATTRIKLDKELQAIRQQLIASEKRANRLELEVMEYRNYRAQLHSAQLDGELESNYKEKLEDLKRQLDIQKRQFEQEKREELEHHQVMKKQVDKKLQDVQRELKAAESETAEQRRRAKRAVEETQDMQLHLQAINRRNDDLVKRQRRHDADLKVIQDQLQDEKQLKERYLREKNDFLAKVFKLEGDTKSLTDDYDSERKKRLRLEKELDELTTSHHGAVGAQEAISLKQERQALERKVMELEQELDDQASDLQIARQELLKGQMAHERQKQQLQKDLDGREEEIEDVRSQAQRMMRTVEQQLEDEVQLVARLQREKRELEQQIRDLQDQHVVRDEVTELQLRRDLRRTKALLKDAQVLLEHYKVTAPSRGVVKQLKNQLEDAESAKILALKAKQNVEAELAEVRESLEAMQQQREDAEARCYSLMKETAAVQAQNQDQEEELRNLMVKYKAQVQQCSVDHITINAQLSQISHLERENQKLRDENADLGSKLSYTERELVDKHKLTLLENKLQETSQRHDWEIAAKGRLENQITSLKEQVERLQGEISSLKANRDKGSEVNRRLQLLNADLQDQLASMQKRETELSQKRMELEHSLERLDREQHTTVEDLKLALRRIDDLQGALEDDLDLTISEEEDESDSLVSPITSFQPRYASSEIRSVRLGSRTGSRTPSVSSRVTADQSPQRPNIQDA